MNRTPRKDGRSRGGAKRRQPAAAPRDFALPRSSTPALAPVTDFAELDMPAALLETLTGLGLTEPFPIQAATLPDALTGRDVLGRGRTGSGKTLAFGLPTLARTAGRRARPGRPLALVLVPTRELAQQVTEALAPYARALSLRSATVVGGMSIGRQVQALRAGAELLVATPGRLADLVSRGDCHLGDVGVLVLDEADQMTDMGFLPQVTALIEQVDPAGQRMLFSATLDRNVDLLVRRHLTDPVVHSVDPPAGAVTTMEHHVLHVTPEDKRTATTEIAARDGRVIMFLDTKHGVNRLTKHLLRQGVRAAALHGGKSQPQRTRTLEGFRTGDVTALVATNVAARGIHVDDLDLVVNVDPPGDAKDYLHRGGRTARAGETGSVVTLVLPDQRRETARMLADAGITPQVTAVRPGAPALRDITGAQAPSGTPVPPAAPAATAKPPAQRQAPGTPSRNRRSRRSSARGRQGSAVSPRAATRRRAT
jgi:superfamily II DNA/RNA helicase